MFCPQCKAEYRQGFTVCADCDVHLVNTLEEAVSHPSAIKTVTSGKYAEQLWSGADPHFYVELLALLCDKNVGSYGRPENSQTSEFFPALPAGIGEPNGFGIWVSEENLPLAKWILDSATEEFEKAPPEERSARGRESVGELSTETVGVCPLCLGEFTMSSSYCPNCGVPLRARQPDSASENSARVLCNFSHPKFVAELRMALRAAEIPFNNANYSGGDIIVGRYHIPNYEVLVLNDDFERATRVMSQVLQHWEFEPGAGFRIGGDPLFGYWPVRAAEKGWFQEELSTLVWSGKNLASVSVICMALREHEIPYRTDTQELGTAKVFSHPDDESRAREIVREIIDAAPPE